MDVKDVLGRHNRTLGVGAVFNFNLFCKYGLPQSNEVFVKPQLCKTAFDINIGLEAREVHMLCSNCQGAIHTRKGYQGL